MANAPIVSPLQKGACRLATVCSTQHWLVIKELSRGEPVGTPLSGKVPMTAFFFARGVEGEWGRRGCQLNCKSCTDFFSFSLSLSASP